jgi:multidrug efflux pump
MMSSWLLSSKMSEGRLARAIEDRTARVTAGYSRLLSKTLGARSAVVVVGLAVLVSIGVMFLSARKELAPQEDHGYVFVQLKAPQYANVDYTSRYAHEMQRIFRGMPEYLSSWFGNGEGGPNNAFGGIILRNGTSAAAAATTSRPS